MQVKQNGSSNQASSISKSVPIKKGRRCAECDIHVTSGHIDHRGNTVTCNYCRAGGVSAPIHGKAQCAHCGKIRPGRIDNYNKQVYCYGCWDTEQNVRQCDDCGDFACGHYHPNCNDYGNGLTKGQFYCQPCWNKSSKYRSEEKSFRARLVGFFKVYSTAKRETGGKTIYTPNTAHLPIVEDIIDDWWGKEPELFKELVSLYGPEPGTNNGAKTGEHQEQGPRSKRADPTVTGGDYMNCLSAEDISNVLCTKRENVIPIMEFYSWRIETNPDHLERLGKQLYEKISKLLRAGHKWVMMVCHIDNHWATAMIRGSDLGKEKTIIYDSAPSEISARLLKKLFRSLGIGTWSKKGWVEPDVVCMRRQPSWSNQCGLHPILVELIEEYSVLPITNAYDNTQPLNGKGEHPLNVLDLYPWREIFSELGPGPIERTIELDIKLLEVLGHDGINCLRRAKTKKAKRDLEGQGAKVVGGQVYDQEDPSVKGDSNNKPSTVEGGVNQQQLKAPKLRTRNQLTRTCLQCNMPKAPDSFAGEVCQECQTANELEAEEVKKQEQQEKEQRAKEQQNEKERSKKEKKQQQQQQANQQQPNRAKRATSSPLSTTASPFEVCSDCNKKIHGTDVPHCSNCGKTFHDYHLWEGKCLDCQAQHEVNYTGKAPRPAPKVHQQQQQQDQAKKQLPARVSAIWKEAKRLARHLATRYDPLYHRALGNSNEREIAILGIGLTEGEVLFPGNTYTSQRTKMLQKLFKQRREAQIKDGTGRSLKECPPEVRIQDFVEYENGWLIQNQDFMANCRAAAEKKWHEQQTNLMEMEFQCAEKGHMLTGLVVDEVVKQLAPKLGKEWKVLSTQLFYQFAMNGDDSALKELVEGENNVALVLNLPEQLHFVAVAYKKGQITIKDSLPDRPDHEGYLQPREEIKDYIGRFIHLLQSNNRQVNNDIHMGACPQQQPGSNDCGVESLISTIMDTMGVTDRDEVAFCRTELQQAHSQLKSRSPVRFTFVSNGCRKNGCGRDLISNRWCAVHHPALQDAMRSNFTCTVKKPWGHGHSECNRPSVNVGTITTRADPNHTDLKKVREEVLKILAPYYPEREPQPQQRSHQHAQQKQQPSATTAPAAPAATAPSVPAEKKRRARNHKELVSFLQCLYSSSGAGDKGGTFEIEYELTDELKRITKSRLLLQLRSQPKWTNDGGKKVMVTKVATRARYCESRCSSWHLTPEEELTEEDTQMTLPDPNAKYYSFFRADPSGLENPTAECGNQDGDLGSDYDFENDGEQDIEEEMRAAKEQRVHPVEAYTVRRCREWNVYEEQPAHVHNLVWGKLTNSTRRNHINILKEMQKMPKEWDDTPMSQAVVDMVLARARTRGWRWSTIASYMSSCGSACLDLHLYTDNHGKKGINLKEWGYFQSALNRACSLAKTRALEPVKSKAFTQEEYDRLEKSIRQSGGGAWYLLFMTWHFAGRIGDVRRLQPQLTNFDMEHEDEFGNVIVKAKYVEGKGAYFWGPYTISTSMPLAYAQQLQEYLRSRPQDQHAFTQADQRVVSKAISQMFPDDHSVRSLRRGRLVTLASQGVSDEKLKLLSGHRRMSTLHRYLGFGHHSNDGLEAAKEISRADHAAQVKGGAETDTKGMWPGRHSGLRAPQGRRTQEPPQLFSMTAPSREECGLPSNEPRGNREHWVVHVPDFAEEDCLQSEELCKEVKAKDLKKAMEQAEEYRTTDKHYGIAGPPLTEEQIPFTKFPAFAVRQMLERKLLSPLPAGSDILSACNGFLNDEEHKERWRIITETLFNRTMDKDKLPPIGYPSGREVAVNVAGKKYTIQFDFKGYYIQVKLGDNKTCYVVKTKEKIYWNGEWTNLFVLNRMPMGGAHSAHVAQTSTWAICEPLMDMDVFLATMIDNVLIASDDADEFYNAVKTFLQRCDKFKATINHREKYDESNRESILKQGEDYARGDDPMDPSVFLGVHYQGNTVCNTKRNVKKLQDAFERLRAATKDSSIVVTRRHLASIVSLSAWMAYVVQIPLYNHAPVLKLFSVLESKAASGSWDEKITITTSIINTLQPLVGPLIQNTPVVPSSPKLPTVNARDYDIVIIVDAYLEGWGGYVWVNGNIFRVKAGWAQDIKHSAWAEPIAASKILKWAREKYYQEHPDRSYRPSVALVTDHEAMPTRQRRPISARGGFSPAYFLNKFYLDLYGEDGKGEGQVFFVQGVKNIADQVSREPKIGEGLSYEVITDRALPALDQFHHPFLQPKKRVWWNR